jgi:uncharacterized protein YbjQ (UPF0145 family)
MIIVNIDYVPGYEIKNVVGVIEANTIQAKHLGKDILSGFKHIVGGHLGEYEEMMTESRASAKQEIIEKAEQLGADAIINLRYSTSAIMQGAAEVLCYGTAVQLEKIE